MECDPVQFSFSILLLSGSAPPLTQAICCLFKCCIEYSYLRMYKNTIQQNTPILYFVQLFSFFRSSAHLPGSLYSFDLIFMLLSLECSTSLWAHNCFLHSFSFLFVSPTVCSVFFWIRSQIRQWPFYAMFISCNNEILFSVILFLFWFWFWFMLCCVFFSFFLFSPL